MIRFFYGLYTLLGFRLINKKDMDKQEKCKCKEPILQPQTKQCGRCNLYIDRVRHILLTSPMRMKCSCHGACCKAILGDDYECQVQDLKKTLKLQYY